MLAYIRARLSGSCAYGRLLRLHERDDVVSGAQPRVSRRGDLWIGHEVETVEPEEADRVRRRTAGEQIGDDFADDGTELEAVSREAARDHNAIVVGKSIDREVLVRR